MIWFLGEKLQRAVECERDSLGFASPTTLNHVHAHVVSVGVPGCGW